MLTSRVAPNAAAPGRLHNLSALPEAEAIKLFYHQAQEKGIHGAAALSKADVQAFTKLVGGHPLAIKLASGLLRTFSPIDSQTRLQQGKGGTVQEMYDHVYRQVWETLEDAAQILLLAMANVGQAEAGGDYLLEISALTENEFQVAVETLNQHSLLETRGIFEKRLYGIHRLTETFLQTDIIGWEPPEI